MSHDRDRHHRDELGSLLATIRERLEPYAAAGDAEAARLLARADQAMRGLRRARGWPARGTGDPARTGKP